MARSHPCASKEPTRSPPSSAPSRPPTPFCAAPTWAPCTKSCNYGKRATASHRSGEGKRCVALARAADDLKEGRRTSHPELLLFPTWGELRNYADQDPAGGDLQPLVDLVDTHGTSTILRAIDQLDDERTAEVTVSTAHKAKGREWPRVRIADDFTPPPDRDEHDDKGQPVPGAHRRQWRRRRCRCATWPRPWTGPWGRLPKGPPSRRCSIFRVPRSGNSATSGRAAWIPAIHRHPIGPQSGRVFSKWADIASEMNPRIPHQPHIPTGRAEQA